MTEQALMSLLEWDLFHLVKTDRGWTKNDKKIAAIKYQEATNSFDIIVTGPGIPGTEEAPCELQAKLTLHQVVQDKEKLNPNLPMVVAKITAEIEPIEKEGE